MSRALVTLTILATVTAPASARINPLLGCADPPVHHTLADQSRDPPFSFPGYNAGTCQCLERKLGWQLEDWPGQQGCQFEIPPPSFDPVRASAAELAVWGIPQGDAKRLRETHDPRLVQVYLQHVKHHLNGEGCGRYQCGPTTSSSLDGLPGSESLCTSGLLVFYCMHSNFPQFLHPLSKPD